jgi:hypothetical protein
MNKSDAARLTDVHNIPCVCCVSMHVAQPSRTEAHHDVSNGYREHSGGHQSTAALCGWHHRAEPLVGWTRRRMFLKYGPSLKYQGPPETALKNKGVFEKCFGNAEWLINETNRALEGYAISA